ncbi:hypothetical protein B0I35DRAFT_157285 [Stachybotrys elegans]|uniref:Uncharacterized protein n=1 Tax=Stachybotrys elegans TaxID=80388 RepID=A0A8K0SWJ1_9HYPO|nr:hypothetical protein B0I35DRAFT_157285 [Stachybotrys elegans]
MIQRNITMSQDELVKCIQHSMHWDEDSQRVFHVDAFNFGKSLIPFLKPDFEGRNSTLISFLKKYEGFRVWNRGIWAYSIRVYYIERLQEENCDSLQIFSDIEQVVSLVQTQAAAHIKAYLVEPGWQQSMYKAGIWYDDESYKLYIPM